MKNDDQMKMDRVRELLNDAKPAGSMHVLYLSLYLLSKIPIKSEKNHINYLAWVTCKATAYEYHLFHTLIMDNVIHTCSQPQEMVLEMCSYV